MRIWWRYHRNNGTGNLRAKHRCALNRGLVVVRIRFSQVWRGACLVFLSQNNEYELVDYAMLPHHRSPGEFTFCYGSNVFVYQNFYDILFCATLILDEVAPYIHLRRANDQTMQFKNLVWLRRLWRYNVFNQSIGLQLFLGLKNQDGS